MFCIIPSQAIYQLSPAIFTVSAYIQILQQSFSLFIIYWKINQVVD